MASRLTSQKVLRSVVSGWPADLGCRQGGISIHVLAIWLLVFQQSSLHSRLAERKAQRANGHFKAWKTYVGAMSHEHSNLQGRQGNVFQLCTFLPLGKLEFRRINTRQTTKSICQDPLS